MEIIDNPVETIRSAEIQDAVTLRDKVVIHAKLSDKTVAESILEKVDKLELMAKEEGTATEGLHIRIKKLILRGAIGIKKGLGKDTVTLPNNLCISCSYPACRPVMRSLIGVHSSDPFSL